MRLLTSLILTCVCFAAFSQKATISGYIEDALSGEKLIGASVYDSKLLIGTTTNVYGFFSLTLDTGEIEFTVSYVGYATHKQIIKLRSDIFQNISLSEDNVLKEVVISASSSDKIHDKTQMSSVNLPMKQIEKLPAFMGERDILKTIQLLPGIQSGSEGSSGLYVRGGGPDQNLILLDGVPVYNASHLFGFFSVFNSSAINNVEIIKGGFPARFGGRVSSVLDIRMKEGNTKKFAGEASFGLISSKLTLEGPIKKDKTSFIISGRRTYIDILAQPFIRIFGGGKGKSDGGDGSMKAGYYFYDVNAKVNHKFSDKSRLFLSTYLGKDRAYITYEDSHTEDNVAYEGTWDSGLQWGNNTTALRYNHIINKKLFANVTGTYSRYKFDLGYESATAITPPDSAAYDELVGFDYISGIYDWGGKIDFYYLPGPNHYVRFGFGETYHTFTPGVNTFVMESGETNIDTAYGANNIYAHEISAYIEDDIKIGGRLKINPGLHYSMFMVKDTLYKNLQPRFSLNFLLRENFSVKASYARMAQYLHLLTNGTIGLPTDLWVPVTDSVPPVIADQVALGFAYTLNNEYEFSIEGYYKSMTNLIEYKDGASFFGSSENWENKIEIGKGESYGVEFFLQKKTGQTSGWIGYTLSWSNRQFDNLNFGRAFSYKYDRRHDVSVALVHELKKKLGKKEWQADIGFTWVYGTGNAISLPISTYRAYNAGAYNAGEKGAYSEIDNYVDRNSFREPAYHRMDLSATFTRTTGRWERSLNISVYNLYNRKNPFYLFLDHNDDNETVLKQLSLFPIIPSISYNLKF
ncbi:MAG: TonB-dependent receptor [Bacteroidota bacterium]